MVGVVPDAKCISVKALNKSGSGVIKAFDALIMQLK